MNRRQKIIFALIFFVYLAARFTLNLPALSKPRELADTVSYLRISNVPLTDEKFWGDGRPFVFPLLLKLAGQNVELASALQLGFSTLAWALLALTVSASLRTVWLRLLSIGILLALSLVPHLASWDFVILTESLSVSWFVLFLALGIWLSMEWRTDKVLTLCVVALFFAFTRDTNAYILLMLAGLLVLAVIFRWMQPRVLILAGFFLFTFFISNLTSDIGARWVFPLNNVIGRRVLSNTEALDYFRSCGMPVTPELMALEGEFANGNDRAFYTEPALNEYRSWLNEHGKTCYMKWLLSDPVHSVGEALGQFQGLITFTELDKFYSRRYDPIIPNFAEPFLYPLKFILPIWVALSVAALTAIWKRAWTVNRLWGIFILLCLPILPHLFIVWHGDAMAPERHALSVGLQLALSLWLFIFLALEQGVEYFQRR